MLQTISAVCTVARKRIKRWQRDTKRCHNADVIFLSLPKSGRTWICVMLSRLYQQTYDLPPDLLLDYDNFHRLAPAVPRFLFTHEPNILGSSRRGEVDDRRTSGRCVVLMVRNPLDVAVSLYFHLLHRGQGGHKVLVRDMTKFQFMKSPVYGVPMVVKRINRWHRQLAKVPTGLLVSYEALRTDTAQEMGRISAFLGEPFSPEEIADAVSFGRFENMAKLEADAFFSDKRMIPADAANRDAFKVRRGKVAGYRDYFSESECRFLEDYVTRRLALPIQEAVRWSDSYHAASMSYAST